MLQQNEIILYNPNDQITLEVLLKDETVWLNRQQMATLFDRDVKTIGKHIGNAQKEELVGLPTVAKFATVQKEGGRDICRNIEYYNLDMVLSVGYRVKSRRGIEFRQWANKVLKEYMMRGYAFSNRMERLEQRVTKAEEKIDFFVRTSLPPVEGVFYNGQIFDAYLFATNLIKSARKTVILIDNYVDETVLAMLCKRAPGVKATIYTPHTEQLQLDLDKHASQYPHIRLCRYTKAHDRFLIIDEEVYHIGASLKDLGKKLFAFAKLSLPANSLLNMITP